MPLIRYRIGDVGAWEEGPCPCGRGLPRLREVRGRVTDFLVGPDGRLVSGVFLATYVVAHRPALGQVQIHQNEVGKICYRLRPGPGFDRPRDTAYLVRAARQYLGEATEVEWEFVDAPIPAEASGKFTFCRSTVLPSFAGGKRVER
jgi:phenylacetate-CoA ligase